MATQAIHTEDFWEMTITRVGSTTKYADGWETAFGSKKKKTTKKAKKAAPKATKKVAAQKKATKKTAKKVAKKKAKK